jgi:cyclopropane fatty-acyl-phospholipid synthase-like methyltransferase
MTTKTARKQPQKKLTTEFKYSLYEDSVQTPEEQVALMRLMYLDVFGKPAYTLREDFCGTFAISRHWAKQGPDYQALGLDLDPEPVKFGMREMRGQLNREEQKRIEIKLQDVMIPTRRKADVIAACNFSFFIFKKNQEMLDYFKAAQSSLKDDGILVLETAGGPGFIHKTREQKSMKSDRCGKFTYYWDQRKFDPITNHGLYSIHYKFPNGQWYKNAFDYDWRVWGITELREQMLRAGFDKTYVYWDADSKREEDATYIRKESAENWFSWICFVVGVKTKKKRGNKK